MTARSIPFAAYALVTLGCVSPSAPSQEALHGVWLQTQGTGTASSVSWCLIFGPGNRISNENRSIGAEGRPSDGLITVGQLTGTFIVRADTVLASYREETLYNFFPKLTTPAILRQTWPFQAQQPLGAVFLTGSTLRLKYYSYPADAPELTTARFTRRSGNPLNGAACGPQP